MNTSEGQTQEPVGGMKWIDVNDRLPIEEKYYHTKGSQICCYWHSDLKRFDLKGVTHWLDENYAPPPAPIKTEGEDEINLLKETINNQHALILSAEQRGYEKAKEEFSAPPSPVGIDVKSFLNVLTENYQAQIAGFYNYDKTDAERAKRNAVIEEYQDLIAIFKAGYSASEGEKAKFSVKEALEIWDAARTSTIDNSSIEHDNVRDMEFVEIDYGVIDKDKQQYFFDKFGIEL